MRAAILVAQGFQDEEFVYPFYRMKEERWDVQVYTKTGGDVLGKYGVPARATNSFKCLTPANLVFIPGGFENPDRLRMEPEVCAYVAQMFAERKWVASICHGPSVLISAGIVRGMRLTAYPSIRDDIINAGGEYLDAPVVKDRNLITAPHYRHNGEFMRTVVAAVNSWVDDSANVI